MRKSASRNRLPNEARVRSLIQPTLAVPAMSAFGPKQTPPLCWTTVQLGTRYQIMDNYQS
jgi:hypothetical protein